MLPNSDMEQNEINFGRFYLDLRNRTLSSNGVPIGLKSKPFDILCVLALADGKLVTKDELMSKVWPGIVVEEAIFRFTFLLSAKHLAKKEVVQYTCLPCPAAVIGWPARERHLRQSPLSSAVLTQSDFRVAPRLQSSRSRT
jgi:hypothetical protein